MTASAGSSHEKPDSGGDFRQRDAARPRLIPDMQSLLRGFRAGFALLGSHSGSAIAAILALALGIGASTTMFSIVYGGTRSLPVAEAESVVAVQRLAAAPGAVPESSVRDYKFWARAPRSFEALGAYQSQSLNLGGDGQAPERAATAAVSSGTFELLRVQPDVGRSFGDVDGRPGAQAVVILSHALWTRRYGGDPGILGRSVRLDGAAYTIIGVMPPRFGFPINAAIWTALPVGDDARDAERVQVFGRLARGVDASTARAELLTIARAAADTDAARAAIALDVVDFVELETPRQTRWGLYLLLLAATGVLFIACVNVASLFIARAASRARDVAVRLALGADRRRILVEQVAESLVLSGLAAIGGLAMAWAGLRAFRQGTADILNAFWMDFTLDATVVLYASVLAIVAAAAASVVPAIRASRADVVATLRDGGRGSSTLTIGRLSRSLLVLQIAMACGLLALTMLLGQAAVALHTRAWPFDPDGLLAAQIGVSSAVLDDDDGAGAIADAARRGAGTAAGLAFGCARVGSSGSWRWQLDVFVRRARE